MINFDGTQVQHVENPKYLGVTLARSLTYNAHLTKSSKKIAARVNLVRKLAGTNWGASADTLRISSLAIVDSTAEYCASTWINSVHVSKINVQFSIQLNNAMRIISGCVKTTQLQWLPVLAEIAPPKLRIMAAAVRELCRSWANSLLYELLLGVLELRLISQRPVWFLDQRETTGLFYVSGAWTDLVDDTAYQR
jgi:hypothetical protein